MQARAGRHRYALLLVLLPGHWHGRPALVSHCSFWQMLAIGYSDIAPVRNRSSPVDHWPDP